jgi:hypothetical protein
MPTNKFHNKFAGKRTLIAGGINGLALRGLTTGTRGHLYAFRSNKQAACSYTDDQLARIQETRIQETFRELYLLDKPGKTFVGEIKTHEEPDDHGNVSEHAAAFLKFAEVVQDIGRSCSGRGA